MEIQEEVEGDSIDGTTDYFFDRIGLPVPIRSNDDDGKSEFDLQSLPAQPLAISEHHRLLFVAHSSGSVLYSKLYFLIVIYLFCMDA